MMRLRNQIIILWVVGALFTATNLDASNMKREISYKQGRLTAHLVEANLKEVLLDITKKAKIEFSLNEAIVTKITTKKVSIQFDTLSLEEGIKKIVRPFSYSMIFGPSGQLQKVVILKSGLKSAQEPISGIPLSELSQSDSQGDLDPSLGPGGGQDEGVPPSAPVPEVPGKIIEGTDEDPHPPMGEESDMGEDLKHPAGDKAGESDVKDPAPSAEGPVESP